MSTVFYTASAAADLRPVAVSCRAQRRPRCSVSALYHIMKVGIGPAKFCELHQLPSFKLAELRCCKHNPHVSARVSRSPGVRYQGEFGIGEGVSRAGQGIPPG